MPVPQRGAGAGPDRGQVDAEVLEAQRVAQSALASTGYPGAVASGIIGALDRFYAGRIERGRLESSGRHGFSAEKSAGILSQGGRPTRKATAATKGTLMLVK